MNNKITVIFFLFIFLLALSLRFAGIRYGLPDLSHPDETRVILDTLSMGHRMSLLPERPDYALLYRYFLLFLFGAYFMIGKISGIFKGTLDFALSFMINASPIYLLARSVSVLFGTAIGGAAYLVGKRIF
ncbi:MAG: hypothetical protein PHF11_07550, partial [Candidatus Omnitrophica bacterium]|nr:hypothetical protein [Candidatus Omnitrophota bacterium]